MKKRFLLSLLVLFASSSFAQSAPEKKQIVTHYLVAPAQPISLPIVMDSVNMRGKAYTNSFLLTTPFNLALSAKQGKVFATDSTGHLSLSKPSDGVAIQLVCMQLKADRYTQSSLSIVSPCALQVMVNRKQVQTKEESQDSITAKSTLNVPLTLEPEQVYTIVVKLLLTADTEATPSLTCSLSHSNKKATLSTDATMKSPYRLYNTVYGCRVTAVSLSNDGKYLLTSYVNKYDKQHTYSYTTLTDMAKKKVVLTTPSTRKLQWMPLSNKLYYVATGAHGYNLITLDPTTLQEEILAKDIPQKNFRWGPQEAYLYFAKKDSAAAVKGPLKRLVNRMDRLPDARKASFICRYSLNTGITEQLTYGYRTTSLLDIRRDGQKLLFSARQALPTRRPFSLNSIYEVDLTSGRVDTLVHNEAFCESAYYAPNGKQLVVLGGPEAFNKVGLNCGDHPIANMFDTQAFIFDLSTKKVTPISRSFNPTVSFLQWNKRDNNIYFNCTDGSRKKIYRYLTKQKKWQLLPMEEDLVRSFTLADEAPVAAFTGVGVSNSTRAYYYDMRKLRSTLFADPMASTMDKIELGKVEDYNFKTADSTTIHGFLCYPPHFDAKKKYPLLVYYYGGTTPTARFMEFYYGAQLFASRGYMVYVVNPSGAIGYGQEFSARHVNAWGDQTADEIIEGTKRVCATHPFINAKRIGCLGASYGGFMTMYLQTKTDIFAAAVSHAGISNLASYWGEGFWGVGYNSVAAADSYPWTNPKLFTRGALFEADKIHTPLLMLHGTVDTNVPMGESIQLYNALRVLDRPVELIQIKGENHHVLDWDKRVLWHNSIMAWFARWLQEDATWWDALYPKIYVMGEE